MDKVISKSDSRFIFRQFGRSLSDPKEPIVDKHVMRAFEIYSLKNPSADEIDKIRHKKSYNSDPKQLLPAYKDWFSKVVKGRKSIEFKYIVDKILFHLGKEIKL